MESDLFKSNNMRKKKIKEKPPIVLPSLKRPEPDPSELKIKETEDEKILDKIPEEDPFDTPPYEPPEPGEGP